MSNMVESDKKNNAAINSYQTSEKRQQSDSEQYFELKSETNLNTNITPNSNLSENDQILPGWEGKIAYKNGLFIRVGHAVVDSSGVKIFNKLGGKEKFAIQANSIMRVIPPSFGFTEVAVSGYRGFTIEYSDGNGKKRKLSFWPKGFGRYPKSDELPSFASALTYFEKDMEMQQKIVNAADDNTTIKYVSTIVVMLTGYFLSGWIGLFFMGGAMALSMKIYSSSRFSTPLKVVLISAIVLGSYVLSFIIALIVVIMLQGTGV